MAERINGIELRDAQTKIERLLLGLLAKEISGMAYGKINIELGVTEGKMSYVIVTEKSKRFNIGQKSAGDVS